MADASSNNDAPLAGVVLFFNGGLGASPLQVVAFMRNRLAAVRLANRIGRAMTKYHDRSNDRERVISFRHVDGVSSIDLSDLRAVSVEDPAGKNAAERIAYASAVGRIHRALAGNAAA